MSQEAPQHTVEQKEAPHTSAFGSLTRLFSRTWKAFAYDHHETLQSIRQEAAQCSASLFLGCAFCLSCAVSLSIIESSHQEDLSAPDPAELFHVNNQILTKEKEAVEDLWSAASLLQESEWKAQAQDTIRRVREDFASRQECDPKDAEDPLDWGIMNSFVYMLTVTTSIGYGHIFPRTNAGRALTIVYAILGIPIFLILMADFGKLFTRLLKSLFVFVKRLYRTATCRRVRKTRAVQSVKPPGSSSPTPPLAVPESTSTDFDKNEDADQGQVREREPFLWEEKKKGEMKEDDDDDKEEEEARPCCCSAWVKKVKGWCNSLCAKKGALEDATPDSEEEDVIDDNFNLPVSLALLILLLYIMFGCFIYTMWEQWTYFEAFYFIFVSMTTIGFGDYVPQHPAFMMMTTVYLVFGLALTAMCINIIQEKLTDTFRQATEKLKESFGHIMDTATQGEEAALPGGKEVEVAEVHGSKKDNPPTDTVTVKKET